MTKFKLVLAGVIAFAAMALSVSSASAYTATISPASTISATSSSVTFSDARRIINIICAVTLGGTLNAGPITIARGAAFGNIDSVNIRTCSGGSAIGLIEDGWALTLNDVPAGLPDNATGMLLDVNDASFELTVTILGFRVVCLYRGTAGANLAAIDTGTNTYRTGSITTLTGVLVGKFSGAASCPSNGALNATFAVSPAQSVTVS